MGCYVILVNGVTTPEASLITELKLAVRQEVGPFATPDYIIITPALPKTRSGKIMRRILRKILVSVVVKRQRLRRQRCMCWRNKSNCVV